MANLKAIQLDPRETTHPSYDVGVEVTISGLKNTFDHHGVRSYEPSAIQQVMAITTQDLKNILGMEEGEKDEYNMATVKMDPDSIGAMALIVAKMRGEEKTIHKDLVEVIGHIDRYGPSMLPPHLQTDELRGLYTVITSILADRSQDINQKVYRVYDVLRGHVSPEEVDAAVAQKSAKDAIERAKLEITDIIPGKLVFVKGNAQGAMALGYEHATTVIAYNPDMPIYKDGKPTGEVYQKYSIARYNDTVDTDIQTIRQELNKKEQGRGGTPTIIGSPQGVSSRLSEQEVIDIVKAYIMPNRYEGISKDC